jgi:hypothetical protein
MSVSYICTVVAAGPNTNDSAGVIPAPPFPMVLFWLSDTKGTFSSVRFYAADNAKNQMLAVALAAISNECYVQIDADAVPTGGGTPHAFQIYNMHIQLS